MYVASGTAPRVPRHGLSPNRSAALAHSSPSVSSPSWGGGKPARSACGVAALRYTFQSAVRSASGSATATQPGGATASEPTGELHGDADSRWR